LPPQIIVVWPEMPLCTIINIRLHGGKQTTRKQRGKEKAVDFVFVTTANLRQPFIQSLFVGEQES
jgi:hypothetical protein